jgi:hypothetical protein
MAVRVKGDGVRFVGLDVDRDFCEIAICQDGRVRSGVVWRRARKGCRCSPTASGRRITWRWRRLAMRWRSRGRSSRTQRALSWRPETSSGQSPRRVQDRPSRRAHARAAAGGRAPARLRAARRADAAVAPAPGPVGTVGAPAHARAKNDIHAALMRNLKGRPPMSDVFRASRPRVAGRARAARRRARDGRWVPAPDRLPRDRDRAG